MITFSAVDFNAFENVEEKADIKMWFCIATGGEKVC